MLMMSQGFLGFLDVEEFIFFVNEFKSGISFKNEMNLEMIKFLGDMIVNRKFPLKISEYCDGKK